MRRSWLTLVLALALAATVGSPVASATPADAGTSATHDAGCDEPKLVSQLIDFSFPVADVSPLRAVGNGPCEGMRPGGQIRIPKGDSTSLCTLNFLFIGTDALQQRHVYMGTAGHCLLAESNVDRERGERSWPPGSGPVVTDAHGKRVGTFAYAILSGDKDFALVRIDNGVAVSPQMCWFGGPTGVNDDRTGATVRLHHYGHGLGVGTVSPARTSVAYGMRDADEVEALGVVIPGDSGGAVISSDGRAVGVVVTIGASYGFSPMRAGTVGITRLTPQLRRAAHLLQQRIQVVGAPLL